MNDRIKLDEDFRTRLFNEALKHTTSLKQLGKNIGCGYSGLKNWRSGKCLIPERFFIEVLNNAGFKMEDEEVNFTRYKENWGTILGGIKSNDKSKAQIAKKMANARKYRKNKIILPEINDDTWELLGVFLGDGCLSKTFSKYDNRWLYLAILTGHMNDDFEYYRDKIIPFIRSLNCNANYKFRPNYTVIEIRINSKKIFGFLKKLGMPVGKKKDKLRIPKEIFSSSKEIKAAILRGLLDTDGHIFARKDEGYKYPYVKITSASRMFRRDIKRLIREFELPAYEHGTDILVRGGKNFRNWMTEIGSSHPLNIKRYNTWLKTGILLPKKGLVV